MKRNKKQQAIIRAVAIILAIGMVLMSIGYLMYAFAEPAYAAEFFWGEEATNDIRLQALGGFIEELQENYKDEVALDDMYVGIYKGLLDSLGDPWSGFYTYDISDAIFSTVEEPFVGVGITFRKTDDGEFLVISTIPGGAAGEAGIRTSDVITKVDNVQLTGDMSSEDVQALVRGEEGSYVTLTIDRFGETLVFTLQRRTVTSQNVNSAMVTDDIGYISVSDFSTGTASAFATERLRMLNSGADALIIDLRGNPGGYLDEVSSICNQLIPEAGKVISTFTQQGELFDEIISTGNPTRQVPIALLVDGESASASEFMAACLKDNGIATLIGETTFGKGVAQTIQYSGNDTSYRYSVFYFVSPDGNDINGVGVVPDIYVKAGGGLSAEEIAKISKTLAPMTESVKYRAGQVGLNVYAAQQRLGYLGYDVDCTAIMDERTVAAVKAFQRSVGGYPYACLDYNTMKNLENAFSHWLSGGDKDLIMERALEYLNETLEAEDAA